jgi:hypothetical protein
MRRGNPAPFNDSGTRWGRPLTPAISPTRNASPRRGMPAENAFATSSGVFMTRGAIGTSITFASTRLAGVLALRPE